MYRVFLKTSAKKALDKLPSKTQKRIAEAIDGLERYGIHAPHTKKLRAPIEGYRTRVGEYRILFDQDAELVVIHRISKRAGAYK